MVDARTEGGRKEEVEGWLIVTGHSLLKQYDYDGQATVGGREGGREGEERGRGHWQS